jgi:hypothetical protein
VRRGAIVAGVFVTLFSLGSAPSAVGQHMLEVRGADTKYRYADWNYTWSNGVVADLFYVGVPGSNEFNIGGGYAIKRGPLVITPLIYAVIGKEGGQRGVKVAVLVAIDKNGWKLLSFLGDYILDFTRAVGKRWEIGVQSGFFRSGGAWNPQVGPLVKLNDRHGAWAASYRFGPQAEFRVGRVLTF